jgi:predicted nucleotidyltransferase
MAVVAAGHVSVDEATLRDFCARWKIRELAVFGSVLRDDFRPDSDVDVLVSFEAGDQWRWSDLLQMRAELERIIGRRVDFVERRAVEQDRNPFRRREILQTARSIYGA